MQCIDSARPAAVAAQGGYAGVGDMLLAGPVDDAQQTDDATLDREVERQRRRLLAHLTGGAFPDPLAAAPFSRQTGWGMPGAA